MDEMCSHCGRVIGPGDTSGVLRDTVANKDAFIEVGEVTYLKGACGNCAQRRTFSEKVLYTADREQLTPAPLTKQMICAEALEIHNMDDKPVNVILYEGNHTTGVTVTIMEMRVDAKCIYKMEMHIMKDAGDTNNVLYIGARTKRLVRVGVRLTYSVGAYP